MASQCKLEDFASTFAPYIDELHDFFRSRGVRFGSAEDVAAVVERLSGDDAFRDEMASMVRAIIYRERDGLAPIELFELMVVAVGGPRVEEAGEEMHGSAAHLLAFVRGAFHSRWKTDADTFSGFEAGDETLDVRAPESEELGAAFAVGTGVGLRNAKGEFETADPDVAPSASVEDRAGAESSAIAEGWHSSTSTRFYRARVVAAERHEPQWPVRTAAPIEQTATRVEAASIEDVLRVESSPTKDEAAPAAARQRIFGNWPAVKLPSVKRPALAWLAVRWPRVRWPDVKLPDVTWPTFRWPAFSSSQLKGIVTGQRRWMWVAGVCALGVAVAAGAWLHDSVGLATPRLLRVTRPTETAVGASQKPSPVVKNLHEADVAAMISAAVQRGRDSSGDSEDQLDAASSEVPEAKADLVGKPVTNARPQPVPPQAAGSPVASEQSAQPVQPTSAPVTAARLPGPGAPENTFVDPAGRAAEAQYGVSPALMRERLLYAPKLQYPMVAKFAHVEGKVVVEAVVGRDGWVTAAKVLSGHRLLRGAALSEVRGRHYRPYTVNDRPMEVATIVAVDFRLHH